MKTWKDDTQFHLGFKDRSTLAEAGSSERRIIFYHFHLLWDCVLLRLDSNNIVGYANIYLSRE